MRMIRSSSPTMDAIATSVVNPLDSACSTPANVKSPGFMDASIRAVYGARAMSSANSNIGLANPIIKAKIELLTKRCHGFSASVIGPPKALNSCHTVIRKSNAHAVYCMIENAIVMNGKYSSIVDMLVPSALMNMPETASIICVIIEAIQLAIPSKIQSKIAAHLLV